MATQQQSPLPLSDFLSEVVRAIDDHQEVSLAAILAHAEEYQELRDFMLKNPEWVARVTLEDPKDGLAKIRELFSDPKEILAQIAPRGAEGLSQFVEPEARFAQSLPIGEVTPAREKAWEDLITHDRALLAKKVAKTRKTTQEFFHRIHTIRAYGTPEATEEVKKVEHEVHLKNFEEIRKELIEIARKRGNKKDAKEAEEIIERFVPQITSEDLTEPIRLATATSKTVLEHPDVENTVIIAESIERGDAARDAVRLSRIATAIEHPVQNVREIPLRAAFEDVAGAVFPNTQDVVDRIFSNTWHATTTAESFVGNMTQRLGEEAVNSPEFKGLIERGNAYARQRSASGGNVLSGLFSIPKEPDPDMEAYLEAVYKKIDGGEFSSNDFFAGKAYANHPDHFHFEFESPFNILFRFGAREEAATVARGTAGAVTRTGLGAWTKESINKLGANFLAKFGIQAGGKLAAVLSGPVGWVIFAVTIVLPYVWDWVKRAGGKIMGAVGGGIIGGVRAASEGFAASWAAFLQTYAKYKDPVPTWVVIAAMVASPVLIALPITSLFPSTASQTQVRRAAVLSVGGGGVVPVPRACDPATDPTCIPLFCDPSKQSCEWPTPCGCITQGPNSGGSHSGLNAIDIGTNGGACSQSYDGNPPSSPPVYAACAGTITSAYFGLGDGEICKDFRSAKCGYGYGNNVYLNCTDGKTQFIYGHLLKPGPGISQGASVQQGQVLGYVDNNGNSTGPHLHFEYRGVNGASVQDITKILPPEYALGYCWSGGR